VRTRIRLVLDLIGRSLSGRGLYLERSIVLNLLLLPSRFPSRSMVTLEMSGQFSLSNDHLLTFRFRALFRLRMDIV
jgi:hypothetical protein